MTDPVERLARLIVETYPGEILNWDKTPEHNRELARQQARAMLEGSFPRLSKFVLVEDVENPSHYYCLERFWTCEGHRFRVIPMPPHLTPEQARDWVKQKEEMVTRGA